MLRTILLATGLLLLGAGGASAQPRGSWDDSCRNAEVRGNTLTASCRGRDGGWRRTSIRYAQCPGNRVRNDDGRLVCEGGGGGGGGFAERRVPGDWDQSCRDAAVRGDRLFAVCRTTEGGWRESTIEFDRCQGQRVRNDDGRLVCASGGGGGGWVPPGLGGVIPGLPGPGGQDQNWAERRVPGDWDQSCRDSSVRGDRLFAVCRTAGGGWRESTIDYTRCRDRRVRNDDGRLVCASGGGGRDENRAEVRVPGSWDRSCRDARVRDGRLFAVCRGANGGWRESSIEYRRCRGDRVRNNDGRLACE
jgi:hypothetical protein